MNILTIACLLLNSQLLTSNPRCSWKPETTAGSCADRALVRWSQCLFLFPMFPFVQLWNSSLLVLPWSDVPRVSGPGSGTALLVVVWWEKCRGQVLLAMFFFVLLAFLLVWISSLQMALTKTVAILYFMFNAVSCKRAWCWPLCAFIWSVT